MIMFNARDWYWLVGSDTSKVYASARNIYVDAATDAPYQAFLAAGLTANKTENEAGIWYLFKDILPLYLWNGATFSQPAAGQYTKDQLQNYNAKIRLEKVSGGMTAAGIPIKTDDISRGFINSARDAAEADPTFTTKWYGSDGGFYDVDAAQIVEMSDALGNHTNACYMVFAQVANDITLNTITTLQQIDAAYAGL